MGVKNQRRYTIEFKQQAVQLAQDLGSSHKAAAQLGISDSNIHNWRTLSKAGGLSGSPGATKAQLPTSGLEDENRRLQRENSELKKVNQILKAAAAFFSQDHLK